MAGTRHCPAQANLTGMWPCTAARWASSSPKSCAGSIPTRCTARPWRPLRPRRSTPREQKRKPRSLTRSNAISVPQILIHRDGDLLAKAVAARLVTRLVDAVAAKDLASLVLTGGGIGTKVLAELAAAPARDA